MDAAARRDYDALADCFSEDATVSDKEQTHRGRNEIRRWQQGTRAKWIYTVTIVGGEPAGENEYVVAVRLEGNFRGGQADLNYDSQCATVSSTALKSSRDDRAPPPRPGNRARCRRP